MWSAQPSSAPLLHGLNVIMTRWHRLLGIVSNPYRPSIGPSFITCAGPARSGTRSIKICGGPIVDLDQCGPLELCAGQNSTEHGSFDMSETIKPEAISRRKALSLMGLAAALGLAAASTAATLAAVTDAEAQTIGMERRHERRHFRRERRVERRVVRHVRRAVRRYDRHY
jgi:hypothetical protein